MTQEVITHDSFLRSLKPLTIEECVDYYFYRRVAHFLIPVFLRLKMTPNQVTTLSMLTGVLASWFVLHQSFFWAGTLAMVAIFFDCCDGQLARLTGQSHPFGRAIDGFFDLVWVTCFWLAIFFSGFLQNEGFATILTLMIPSALSMIVHCWRFDGVKIKYLERAQSGFSEKDVDFPETLELMKKSWRQRDLISVFWTLLMAFQMYFFVRGKEKKKREEFSQKEQQDAEKTLGPVIKSWTWLGEGHHNTLVILGVFLAPISPYFLIFAFMTILVPMNLWWWVCEWRWRKAYRSLLTMHVKLEK